MSSCKIFFVKNLIDGVTNSVYDAANRLLTAEALSGMTTYSYDAAGNRRTVEEPSGDLTTYTWNAQNQTVQVELPNDDVITYVWAPVNKNSEERIVSRDDGVEVQQLLWDNNNVIREADDLNSVEAEYTYQPQPYGDLVSDYRDTESNFYRFDAQGSTTGLTDATGNTTDEYRYTAFGKPANTSGTTETPYKWIGQLGYRQDETIGLHNLRARGYDPQTGQFTSADPLGMNAGDSNFYRYVGNNVINAVDPSGLWIVIDPTSQPIIGPNAGRQAAICRSYKSMLSWQTVDVLIGFYDSTTDRIYTPDGSCSVTKLQATDPCQYYAWDALNESESLSGKYLAASKCFTSSERWLIGLEYS